MNIKKLLHEVEVLEIINEKPDMDIVDIAFDSRNVIEGCVFVAMTGFSVDGHKYMEAALKNGASVIICEKVDNSLDVMQIVVKNSRRVLSKISANFFDHPSRKLKVVGITGTKGKTSIANFLYEIFVSAGIDSGVIGTIGIKYHDKTDTTINTTPESYIIQKRLKEMLDAGVEIVFMEASSTGLKMNRVQDIDFDYAIFTNLSQDHIGPKEHPDLKDYIDSKKILFAQAKKAYINIDSDMGAEFVEASKNEVYTYGIENNADYMGKNVVISHKINENNSFDFVGENIDFHVETSLAGLYNIYNLLGVICVCQDYGISIDKIKSAILDVYAEGRMEILKFTKDITVILDYAHNGLSLESTMDVLRDYKHNKLILMFGSVGGRTKERRKELGDIAAKYADISIITSDNPDFEDPQIIIDDIKKSFVNSKCQVYEEIDRKKAIKLALSLAEKDDIVLLAGKGHEKYQLINGEKIHYSDREEVENIRKDK